MYNVEHIYIKMYIILKAYIYLCPATDEAPYGAWQLLCICPRNLLC